MSLRREILSSVSVIFFVIFLGLMFAGINSSRDSLERQLGTQAQDAASELSLELGRTLSGNDQQLGEFEVDSVFDRGFYQKLTVFSKQGLVLFHREVDLGLEGVPEWFAKTVPLNAPEKEAFFSRGWNELGKVVVISQQKEAYQALWMTCLQTTGWTVLAYLVAVFLSHLMLQIVLKPLSEIEHLALEIAERRFVQMRSVPQAKELARVVFAMNFMSLRIAETLRAESTRAEGFRKEAYEDGVTGLDNRRSFDLRFSGLLDGDVQFSGAAMIGLEVNNLKVFNNETSYRQGNIFLRVVAQLASQFLGSKAVIACRTGGSSFAFVMLDQDVDTINCMAYQLRDLLQQEVDQAPDRADVSFSLGVVSFDKSDKPSQVMSRLDLSIETARQLGLNALHFERDEHLAEEAMGSRGWRELIQSALSENRWILMAQPVVALANNEVIHEEIMSRLVGREGDLIPASLFVPMALRHRLMSEVDRALLELVFRGYRKVCGWEVSLAVNISSQSLQSKEFIKWLDAQLDALGEGARNLSFEVSEYGCSLDFGAVKNFASMIRGHKASFGIDNVGLAPNSLQMLRDLPADYIKLVTGLVQEAQHTTDARSLIKSIVGLAHSLDIKVIAQGVEFSEQLEMLLSDQIAGGQGYLFGAPMPKNLDV